MITPDSLTEVGQIFKPHGIKGEVSITLDYDFSPEDVRCFLIDREGIFVPFFVAESRRRGSESWLVRFEGVENERQAAEFSNAILFALTAELPVDFSDEDADGVHLYDLEGFRLIDGEHEIGVIRSIDDSTVNILFEVETPAGLKVLVPFAEELLVALDPENRTLTLDLPAGILDIN
ncbi:MAG: ribosome maturation factor RimM [Muribaculaceae bacterium]|nr:ribosome maturation factor RimM [Muribaculaceae bacterium]